jgi:hypothetical protein
VLRSCVQKYVKAYRQKGKMSFTGKYPVVLRCLMMTLKRFVGSGCRVARSFASQKQRKKQWATGTPEYCDTCCRTQSLIPKNLTIQHTILLLTVNFKSNFFTLCIIQQQSCNYLIILLTQQNLQRRISY